MGLIRVICRPPAGAPPPNVQVSESLTDGSIAGDVRSENVIIPGTAVPDQSNNFGQYVALGTTAGVGEGPSTPTTTALKALWPIGTVLRDRASLSVTPGFWSAANEDTGRGNLQLMRPGDPGYTPGPPGGSGQYLRKSWPALAGARCTDQGIELNSQFVGGAHTEVWTSHWLRFSSNWNTNALAQGCSGLSNPDFKFLFWRINPSSGRVEIKLFNGASQDVASFMPFQNPNSPTNYLSNPSSSQVFGLGQAVPVTAYRDAQWHQWRGHVKIGVGVSRLRLWFDNTKFFDTDTYGFLNPYRPLTAKVKYPTSSSPFINVTGIYGMKLGANVNQQAIHPQPFTADFGKEEYYFEGNDPGWT